MNKTTALATLAATLLVGSASHATDTRVALTDTLIVEAHADNRNGNPNDDDYGAAITRLNLTGNAGNLSSQLRIDGFAFVDPPSDEYPTEVILERLSVEYRLGDWRLTAGDYFQQLGRGIVLAIRKVDEAGLDIALRGGTVNYRGRDHRLTLFAGLTNTTNLDSVNQRRVDETLDTVAGYNYELRAIDPVDVAVFGAYIEPRFSFDDVAWRETDAALIDALDLEAPTGAALHDYSYSQGLSLSFPSLTSWLTLYMEGEIQTRQFSAEQFMGYGSYGLADLAFGDYSFVLESIYLDDWSIEGSGNSALDGEPFRYNQAPTLERIDQESLNHPSVHGGRVRAERYFFEADTTAYVAGNLLVNDMGESRLRQMHGYGGVKAYYQDAASRFEISGGYRDETTLDSPPAARDGGVVLPGYRQHKSMIEAQLDWAQFLGNGLSLHVTNDTEFRTLGDAAYQRGTLITSVERAGLGTLAFEFGYDTQSQSADQANFFYAGHVRWEMSDHFTLTAVGGTQRGGIKCLSGVCRQWPAFAGGRLELISRF